MGLSVEPLSRPGFEQVLSCRDGDSGLRAVIAIHSTRRGAAFGGIRRRRFDGVEEAVEEACELARAMSRKCALAGLPAGGGKTVLLDDGEFDVVRGYETLGKVIEGLGGHYVCGPDVGTGPEQLAAVRRSTDYVNPQQNDAAASTAAGVLAGLRGATKALGWESLARRRVVIQGLGAVGSSLAQSLLSQGAEVMGADVSPAAGEHAVALGVRLVDPERPWEEACDVFMPCALGHVLTPDRVNGLSSRLICGSANNQASGDEVPWLLHRRGCLWLPDILVSAGAVIEGVWTVLHGQTPTARDKVEASLKAIEGAATEFCSRSMALDCPPALLVLEAADAALSGRT